MAKAKKLPSGSWRCLAYSHTEKVLDPKTGKMKDKRIYESFTSDDPSPRGRKEAELAAAEFRANKSISNNDNGSLTLTKAIDKYINSSDGVLSPSTIRGYRIAQRNSFQQIMDKQLKSLTNEILQDAVNQESKRKVGKKQLKKISPKTIKNNYGLITAVLNRYYPRLNCTVRLPQMENNIPIMPEPEQIMKAFKGDRLELAVLLAMWLSFTMSEIRGLTKSKSLDGNYIVIREVKLHLGKEDVIKNQGKAEMRNRMHHVPPYIMELINNVEGDVIVPYSPNAIYKHFSRVLKREGIPHISFHGLRHPYVKHTTKKYNSEKQKTQATKMDLIAWVFRFYTFNYSKRSWIL